jgi:hypothetical protein
VHAARSGWLLTALSSAIAIAVAVLAVLLVHHHDGGAPARTVTLAPAIPGRGPKLPLGTPAGPGKASEQRFAAIPATVRTVASTSDPHGGPAWGLREFRIDDGETCVQIGRVADGTIGVLGQDNAWLNDGLFHPIAPNAYTGRVCAPTDRHGHAFLNVSTHSGIASAAVDWGDNRQSHDCNRGNGPAGEPPCPRQNLRDLDYGLLGPDAVSVAYVRSDGVHVVQPTSGPDGAYLIVRPHTPAPCVLNRDGSRGCSSGGMTQGPSLQSGTITEVQYRDGHLCRLPLATPSGVRQASCPPVGYVPPRQPHLTAATIAAPITVRLLPYAPSYCGGNSEPAFRLCRPNETPLGGTSRERLVNFSFTAPIAADGVTSTYQFQDSYAAAGSKTCPGGGSGGPSDLRVHAGQTVTFQDQISIGCHGLVTGSITYTPNTGPGGTNGGSIAPNRTPRTLLVGRFRFRMP